MYCVACGSEIHEQAVICTKCGVATNFKKKRPLSRRQLVGYYFLAVFMPILGLILGIYALFKDEVGHGVGLIALSVFFWAFFANLMGGIH